MQALIESLLRNYPDLEGEWTEYQAGGHTNAATFLQELARHYTGNQTFTGDDADTEPFPEGEGSPDAAGVPLDVPGRGFTLGDVVGRGAMGEVRLASDRDLNRTVAWKVMTAKAAARPDLAAAFWAEAQITSQLDHPNIVPIYGLTRAPDGRLAYTMRRIEGDTLEEWITSCRATPEDEAHGLPRRLEVFLKICDAMNFAHHRGVLHRDLKPSNLMLGPHGEVYVMDWGIAILLEAGADQGSPRVEGYGTGGSTQGSSSLKVSVTGTPGYMSPEQALGEPSCGPASDQYALGLILQELITLEPAIQGDNARKLLAAHIRGEVSPMVSSPGAPLSPELVAIVARATQTNPDRRYPSVGDLADDLRRHLRGDAVLVLPDNLWRGGLRRIRRHAHLAAMVCLGALLALATTIVGSQALLLRDRAVAARHERALSELMAATATQAARIDSRFVRFEGQVETLAASARLALRSPEAADEGYFLADFRSGSGPPDLSPSRAYGAVQISLAHPVLLTGDNGSRDAARLLPLHPELLRAVAHTLPGPPAATADQLRRRLQADGAQAAYATVALDSGAVMSFPGHSEFPDGYDPRSRPWYQTGHKAEAVTWGAPYVDAGTGQLNLPCSAPIVVDGKHVGVASLKLSLAAVVGDLLAGDTGSRALVDANGQLLASDPPRSEAPPFRPEEAGSYRLEAGRLRVVQPIESHGWALIVEGDAGELLADKGP